MCLIAEYKDFAKCNQLGRILKCWIKSLFNVQLIESCFTVLCSHLLQSKTQPQRRGEYNVYSTFQSHEPEFDYLKSLEIEEKINKIKWLPQQNAAYFLLSTNGQSLKVVEKSLKGLVISHQSMLTCGFCLSWKCQVMVRLIPHYAEWIYSRCKRRCWYHMKMSFWLTVWTCWCFAWMSGRHQLKSFSIRTSCMAATAGTHTFIWKHVPPHACMLTSPDGHTHTHTHTEQRDVLQIVRFTHGCYRRASGGWSRWRVLWRWPRCSDTNIHSGN